MLRRRPPRARPFQERVAAQPRGLCLDSGSSARRSDFIRAKTSDRSSVSMVMPWRCRASSSMRTVLKAVVRAPMAPTTMPLHAVDHPADAVEVLDVSPKNVAAWRGDRVRLERRELHPVLAEDVHDGELAAERVAPELGRHLVQLVRVGLDEDRHAAVLERRDGAGLVAEVRQAQDHAAELAAVLAQEVGVLRALVGASPPRRGACRRRPARCVACPIAVSTRGSSARASAISEAGKNPRVAKEQGKGRLACIHGAFLTHEHAGVKADASFSSHGASQRNRKILTKHPSMVPLDVGSNPASKPNAEKEEHR